MQTKKIYILLMCVFISVSVFAQKTHPSPYYAKWVLVKGSSLKVAGSTNVNKFNCDIVNYSNPDTIYVLNPSTQQYLPVKGALRLDISKFDCHLAVMTNDLFKTLKGKQFPTMLVQFVSLSKFPDFNAPNSIITGVVIIELAGVLKSYIVNYTFSRDAAKTIHLIGKRQVNFSDFNLTPPRKLGGLIKTKQELDVEFHLMMRNTN